MPSKLKYGVSFGSTETSLISFTIADTLYSPKTLMATISNQGGALDTRYSPFDEIEIVEDTTNLILFRGRIKDISKPIHPTYGGVIELTAFDNLQELASRTLRDGTYEENGRDELIRTLIDSHTNLGDAFIDTANHLGSKLLTSADTDPKQLIAAGSSQTVLKAITDEAQSDPWTTLPTNTNRGFAFYLDETLDFNYHKLGTVPVDPDSGTMGQSGLTVEYNLATQVMNGSSPSKMQMMAGSSFNEPGGQVVTQCFVTFQSEGGKSKSIAVQRFEFQLDGSNTHTNAPFNVGQLIAGGTSGSSAIVQHVEQGAILVSHVDEELATANIPIFQGGETITQQNSRDTTGADGTNNFFENYTSLAGDVTRSGYPSAVLTSTHTPSYTTGMHIERNVAGHQYRTTATSDGKTKAMEAAATILRKGFSVTGQLTGTFSVVGYPEYRISSTYYPVRAGQQIGVTNTVTANVNNEDMTVRSIAHTQAPGRIDSTIQVVSLTEGSEVVRSTNNNINNKATDGNTHDTSAIGDVPISLLGDDFSLNCNFVRDSRTQLSWTAGELTYANGSPQAIVAGASNDANQLNAQMATDGTQYFIMAHNENLGADGRLHIEAGIPIWTAANASASTTVAAVVTEDANTVTVASATGFSVSDYIKINNEYMQITAINSNTFTVTRGTLRVEGATGSDSYSRKPHIAGASAATVREQTFTNPNNNFDLPVSSSKLNRKLIGIVKAGATLQQYCSVVFSCAGPSLTGAGNALTTSVSALSTDLGTVDAGQHLTLDTATPSGSVPIANPHGMFRYSLDGNADANPTLAFLSGQTNATPNLENAGSSFWSMLSESDGGTGSRLIFEPIVDYGSSDATKNRAYIGFHNPLFEIKSTTFTGNLTGDLTGDIYITANNTTNETVYPTFVDGATGTQGLETDTELTYNPSTGLLSLVTLSATDSIALPTPVANTSVPTGQYGLIQFAEDGGHHVDASGGTSLGFLAGQTDATPERDNVNSSFWTMISESDGGTGSRIILEPIVPWGAVDSTKNRAWLGYHNYIYGSVIYYMYGGNGSSTYPSFTFSGDIDTGMYRIMSNQIGLTVGGTATIGISADYLWPIPTSGTIELGLSSRRWQKIWTVDIDSTNSLYVSSDSRLKENIQLAKLGLDFINDLNPVTYKMKEKRDGKIDATHYGIVAQEVVETLKDHGIDSLEDFGGISYNEEDEGESYYGAAYTEFIPILMKAIQELSAEVKDLKEKI